MPAKTHDGEARPLAGSKDPARESSGEGGKDGRTEEQGLPDRSKTASTTGPRPHTRTNERPVEKRSTEQTRSRSWIHPTSACGRGSAQGAGATSRVFATHLDATVTDATGSSAASVRSDGSLQQLAETQQSAAAWTSEETRRKTSRG